MYKYMYIYMYIYIFTNRVIISGGLVLNMGTKTYEQITKKNGHLFCLPNHSMSMPGHSGCFICVSGTPKPHSKPTRTCDVMMSSTISIHNPHSKPVML